MSFLVDVAFTWESTGCRVITDVPSACRERKLSRRRSAREPPNGEVIRGDSTIRRRHRARKRSGERWSDRGRSLNPAGMSRRPSVARPSVRSLWHTQSMMRPRNMIDSPVVADVNFDGFQCLGRVFAGPFRFTSACESASCKVILPTAIVGDLTHALKPRRDYDHPHPRLDHV